MTIFKYSCKFKSAWVHENHGNSVNAWELSHLFIGKWIQDFRSFFDHQADRTINTCQEMHCLPVKSLVGSFHVLITSNELPNCVALYKVLSLCRDRELFTEGVGKYREKIMLLRATNPQALTNWGATLQHGEGFTTGHVKKTGHRFSSISRKIIILEHQNLL